MGKRAVDFFSGGNLTEPFKKDFSDTREELVLICDDGLLTFTAGATTHKLFTGEVFDEEILPFKSIEIVASGSFRGYVRDTYI
jgi:hypothetical protein